MYKNTNVEKDIIAHMLSHDISLFKGET